jgi:hypothetical protein
MIEKIVHTAKHTVNARVENQSARPESDDESMTSLLKLAMILIGRSVTIVDASQRMRALSDLHHFSVEGSGVAHALE